MTEQEKKAIEHGCVVKGGVYVDESGNEYRDENGEVVVPLSDASNPLRRKAIRIIEAIATELGDEELFDGDWYHYEDLVTEILADK